MNLLLKVLLVSVISVPCARGYIYELRILRKFDQKCKSYRYFFGLSDFHDKLNESTQPQMAEIDKVLLSLDIPNSHVYTEDLSSKGSDGRFSCGRYYVNSRGGILGGLAQKCQQMGLSVTNIEYRYCRVSALGPVLNNLDKRPHMFPSVKGILIASLAQEIDIITQEIQSYNDGPELAGHYKKGLDEIAAHVNKFKQDEHKAMNVADYLEKHSTDSTRLDFLKDLLTFDSGLLDLKMVHAIVNSDKEMIVTIAGGAHIGRVSDLLEKIGFESVHSTKIEFSKEFDLNRCLGSSIIEGKYCVRPKPIPLDTIHQYITKK